MHLIKAHMTKLVKLINRKNSWKFQFIKELISRRLIVPIENTSTKFTPTLKLKDDICKDP